MATDRILINQALRTGVTGITERKFIKKPDET
jgi:hypothetical protein